MFYTYCSICGSKLKERNDKHLECIRCTFVNYRNPKPTVTALVLYRNQLLLTRRAKEPFRGWWDLPGGFIDLGETPEQAIVRELKEETGLDIVLNGLFGIYTGTHPSLTEPSYIISIVYRASTPTGTLQAADDVIESKWFKKDEIPRSIAFDSNQRIIKDFIKIWN